MNEVLEGERFEISTVLSAPPLFLFETIRKVRGEVHIASLAHLGL